MKLMFEASALSVIASQYRERYGTNEPFPHIVLDDFLPKEVADAIATRFPKPRSLRWIRHENENEIKLGFSDETRLDECIREVLYQLNSRLFLEFLERLTGITGLISDPYYHGGGLHQIEPGGYLNVHADFSHHSKLGLRRRLNLLIYFNEDWKDEYGGHLELWDREMKFCVRKVVPVFNRCVIFSTTDFSYHGHPEPLRCPSGVTRKSLALYYYTSYTNDALTSAADPHSTLFRLRSGEDSRAKTSLLRRSRKVLLLFVPPIARQFYELLRRLRTEHPR